MKSNSVIFQRLSDHYEQTYPYHIVFKSCVKYGTSCTCMQLLIIFLTKYDTYNLLLKQRVKLDYNCLMFSILKGGKVHLVPPCLPRWVPPVQSQVVSSCLLGPSWGSLCRIFPYALGCLWVWYGVKALLGIGFPWRSCLNRLILAPSSHCGC